MSETILLDTCAVIWIATDADIDPYAVDALDKASDNGQTIYISPMTAWEIGMLSARGRIASPMSAEVLFGQMTSAPGVSLSALSPNVLISSSFLPGDPPRDPADRIIIATAREAGLTIMTRDRHILAYADAGHVQAMAC